MPAREETFDEVAAEVEDLLEHGYEPPGNLAVDAVLKALKEHYSSKVVEAYFEDREKVSPLLAALEGKRGSQSFAVPVLVGRGRR